MKKHILIPLAAIILSVIGCSKPNNGKDNPQPPTPPQEQITIPSAVDVTPVLSSEGGEAKISFTASAEWTASVISTKANSWVDVRPKSGGPGPAEIKITATPNDTYVERNATIQIKCSDKTKDIVLTQKQLDNITVTTDKVELGAEGGSVAVEVSSNVAVTMTIPEDAGWITENKTKSVSTSTFHLDIAANETYEARSTEITFSNEESGLSEKITVNQKGKTFIHVTSVALDRSKLTLIEDEKDTLIATVSPEDATDKSVEWSCDKPEVASVDENGEVTAKSAGTASVTVATKDGGKTATCIVTVDAKFRPVTSVTLDQTSVSLKPGETVTLTATVNPDDATDKTVTWTTSSTVATVNNGVVTAKKVGTATITAKAGDKTATCEITVEPILVTNISLNKTSLTMFEGDSERLIATVSPDNATNRDVIWTSSNSSIVKVDQNGKVTATKAGVATITAASSDGAKTATCTVTVNPFIHVTGISLDYNEIELELGKTFRLTATVTPDNATNKNVIWTSYNSNTKVDQNGVVSAIRIGNWGWVVAKTEEGNFSAGCTVHVVSHIESITLNVSQIEMSINQEYDLIATIKPADTTDKVVWTSSNQKIVSVSNGHLKTVASGKATITAMREDEKVKASCEVTVKGEGLDPSIGDWEEGGDYSGEAN